LARRLSGVGRNQSRIHNLAKGFIITDDEEGTIEKDGSLGRIATLI
jgi:hypothetical protein